MKLIFQMVVTTLAWAASQALALPLSAFQDPQAQCFDRSRDGHLSVVDSHLHFMPFGGPGIPYEDMLAYAKRSGVRFVNVYGIGQTLPKFSSCVYYLDCPGVEVAPNSRNDVRNAEAFLRETSRDVHVTVSMTFPDAQHPATIMPNFKDLEARFPGVFHWAGEINLVKQALFNNGHYAASEADLRAMAPFMQALLERDMPLTIHADLGNTEEPFLYFDLIDQFLALYPDNKIVWAHMGLSKELTHLDARQHIAIMTEWLQRYPNLAIDLAWRVIDDFYFDDPDIRADYVKFINAQAARILPGTDFVAAAHKTEAVYREEHRVTSRINRYLDDEAFRYIALGQSYFDFTGLPFTAPRVCAPPAELADVAAQADQ